MAIMPEKKGARSSVEEHYSDKVGAVGSSPTEPTIEKNMKSSGKKSGLFEPNKSVLSGLPLFLDSKYPLLNQMGQLLPSGFLFACFIRALVYNIIVADNANTPTLLTDHFKPAAGLNTLVNAAESLTRRPVMSTIHLRDLIYNDLIARGKTEAIAREWGAVVAEFELVCGSKESYDRADVTAFLARLRKRGLLQSTINKDLKAIKLLAEIQHWGQGPQGSDFPKLSLKRVSPDEIRRTILSKEAVGSMISLGRQGLLTKVELCFLALSTIYGLRRVEMVRLNPSDLNPETIIVNTAKGGSRTTHIVPPQIAPYLRHFKHYKADSLTHMFHRIAEKCGVDTKAGYGYHSIRRSLATELILSEASALNVLRFMRWSDASTRGEFGMLAIYAKKDQPRIDEQIFAMHPFLPYWGIAKTKRERK